MSYTLARCGELLRKPLVAGGVSAGLRCSFVRRASIYPAKPHVLTPPHHRKPSEPVAMNQIQKHREACDACHNRKIRCPFVGPGACSNCQNTGQVCVFSPRDEMGRPKKCNTKKGREGPRKRPSTKNSLPKKQEDSDQPTQSTNDKTWPNVFTQREGSMPVEAADLSFPDEWQNFLSFPTDEFDSILYAQPVQLVYK